MVIVTHLVPAALILVIDGSLFSTRVACGVTGVLVCYEVRSDLKKNIASCRRTRALKSAMGCHCDADVAASKAGALGATSLPTCGVSVWLRTSLPQEKCTLQTYTPAHWLFTVRVHRVSTTPTSLLASFLYTERSPQSPLLAKRVRKVRRWVRAVRDVL